MITVNIDGKDCITVDGVTIIDAARSHGIDIPALGYDPRVSPPSNFEAAFVEVVEKGKIHFVSATSTKASDGMVIRTQSDALTSYRRIYLQALLRHHWGDCVAPCVLRCPANIDIQKYIYHVSCGNFTEALAVIKDANPLPAVCGRVCPHPCESDCRRNAIDGAVNINGIKRFVADWDALQMQPYAPVCLPDTGYKIAVVGAGPAGLSAAWFLRRRGHSVTIFEMQEKAGGMLRWGIPYYRLPEKDLDREIEAILDLGVEISYNKKLGRDFTLESLKRDGFAAVFVGLGAQKAQAIGARGEDAPGVMSGLDFLARLARGERPSLGHRAIVIGGGNTAMDAARSAVRLGVKEVIVAYRRTRQEMPAQPVEIDEAIEEGVNIQFLTAPVSIAASGGELSLACVKMALGEPDASGRRRPVPQPGSEFTLTATTIISAIGQTVDSPCLGDAALVDKRGNVAVDRKTLQSALPWVFAGGDCVTGPDIAIAAIGAGKRAAAAIDEFVRTGNVQPCDSPYTCSKGAWRDLPSDMFRTVARAERREVPVLAPHERKTTFDESSRTWDTDTAIAEADRCLACGCTERYDCSLRNYASAYGVAHDAAGPQTPLPVDENHPIITRDPGKCILCGLCLKVCREMEGVSALSFYETNDVLTIGPNDHRPLDLTVCVSCGHCAMVCPTGALTLKPVLPDVYRALKDPQLTTVARGRFAGAVRLPQTARLQFRLRHLLGGRPHNHGGRHGISVAPGRGRRAAANNVLLPGLDQLLRKDGAGSSAAPVLLQIAPADVRRGDEAVFRQRAQGAAGTSVLRLDHALQRQKIRGHAPRIPDRQHSGRGPGPHHVGHHDHAGGKEHRSAHDSAGAGGCLFREGVRRGHHLRRQRRRGRSGAQARGRARDGQTDGQLQL